MKKKFNNKGIGLIILTTIILALGIIIAILLETANIDLVFTKNRKTKNKLKEIREAIEIFTLENGRYPCPASFAEVPADTNFGLERRVSGDCDESINGIFRDTASGDYYGTIPVRTLGLADNYMIDQWNNKIGYIISGEFVTENALNEALGDENINADLAVPDGINDAVYLMLSYGRTTTGTYGLNSTFATESDTINQNFPNLPTNDDYIVIGEPVASDCELQSCIGETISINLYDKDGNPATPSTTAISFESAKHGEVIYANETCPIIVSDPVLSTDKYYAVYNSSTDTVTNGESKVKRGCDCAVWQDVTEVCKELPKCDRTTVNTIEGKVVTWQNSPPTEVVNNGIITGSVTVNSISETIELKCVVENDGTAKFYVVSGGNTTCNTSDMPNQGNATWNQSITYNVGDPATATGCQSGFMQNTSGLDTTMTCGLFGWKDVSNPCVTFACSNSDMSNHGYAIWEEGPTYAENDVATATGCQTGYVQNDGGLATMTCGASGWENVLLPCQIEARFADCVIPTMFNTMKFNVGESVYCDDTVFGNPRAGATFSMCEIDTPSGTTRVAIQYESFTASLTSPATTTCTMGDLVTTYNADYPTGANGFQGNSIANGNTVSGTCNNGSSATPIATCNSGSWNYGTQCNDCNTSMLSGVGYAEWGVAQGYNENEIATATSCQTGYVQSDNGLPSITCGSSGWGTVNNPCQIQVIYTSNLYPNDPAYTYTKKVDVGSSVLCDYAGMDNQNPHGGVYKRCEVNGIRAGMQYDTFIASLSPTPTNKCTRGALENNGFTTYDKMNGEIINNEETVTGTCFSGYHATGSSSTTTARCSYGGWIYSYPCHQDCSSSTVTTGIDQVTINGNSLSTGVVTYFKYTSGFCSYVYSWANQTITTSFADNQTQPFVHGVTYSSSYTSSPITPLFCPTKYSGLDIQALCSDGEWIPTGFTTYIK